MKKLLIPMVFAFAIYLSLSFAERPSETISIPNRGHSWEEFNPELYFKLRTVEDVIRFTDSAMGAENRQSLDYAEFLASTLRKRFHHGYSYYNAAENWLAWVCGKLVWADLNAIVLPDDILKHPNAACSQQAIVLSACFEEIGIPYREVDLVGHFVLEGKVNNKWYYFDTNLEPRFINKRKSLQELISGNELRASYINTIQEDDLRKIFSSISYKPENAPIALKAKIFHRVTYFLSITILLLLLASLFVILKKRKHNPAPLNF